MHPDATLAEDRVAVSEAAYEFFATPYILNDKVTVQPCPGYALVDVISYPSARLLEEGGAAAGGRVASSTPPL